MLRVQEGGRTKRLNCFPLSVVLCLRPGQDVFLDVAGFEKRLLIFCGSFATDLQQKCLFKLLK